MSLPSGSLRALGELGSTIVASAALSSSASVATPLIFARNEQPAVVDDQGLGSSAGGSSDEQRSDWNPHSPALSIRLGSRDRSGRIDFRLAKLARHLLAELDAELVERVDAEQDGIGEGAMLVEGDQRAEARGRAGRGGSSRRPVRRDSRDGDRRSCRRPSAPRPGRRH